MSRPIAWAMAPTASSRPTVRTPIGGFGVESEQRLQPPSSIVTASACSPTAPRAGLACCTCRRATRCASSGRPRASGAPPTRRWRSPRRRRTRASLSLVFQHRVGLARNVSVGATRAQGRARARTQGRDLLQGRDGAVTIGDDRSPHASTSSSSSSCSASSPAWSAATCVCPRRLYETLAIYLLLAIGLKGGIELSRQPIAALAPQVLACMALGFAIPFVLFPLLRGLKLSGADAASVAAHYGSVSVVTFAVASAALARQDIATESHAALWVAVMEAPGLIAGILLARRAAGNAGSPMARVGARRAVRQERAAADRRVVDRRHRRC